MKYEVTFIHKNGKPQSDTTLIFGDRDAVDIAKKCFEYGKSNNYSDLEIRKVRDENKENKEESKTGHCKDCKYFEYDSVGKVDGMPLIVAHEVCTKWGEGCKTEEDGFCFMFEKMQKSEV